MAISRPDHADGVLAGVDAVIPRPKTRAWKVRDTAVGFAAQRLARHIGAHAALPWWGEVDERRSAAASANSSSDAISAAAKAAQYSGGMLARRFQNRTLSGSMPALAATAW
jgi:hypothetical protein